MGLNNIEQLLERYYAGETSLEEENQLRAFFASDEVPAAMATEQQMFSAHAQLQEVKMPEDMKLFPEEESRKRRRAIWIKLFGWGLGIGLLAIFVSKSINTQVHEEPVMENTEAVVIDSTAQLEQEIIEVEENNSLTSPALETPRETIATDNEEVISTKLEPIIISSSWDYIEITDTGTYVTPGKDTVFTIPPNTKGDTTK